MENTSIYFTYTTPCGYTYKYLKEHPDYNPELRELLDAAPGYKHFISISVTPRLFEYLKKKYHIEMGSNSEASAIFKNVEIGINILTRTNGFITIGIFASGNHKNVADEFAKKLNYKYQMSKRGLQYVMDPNHGGSTSQEVQDMVSLIHFG